MNRFFKRVVSWLLVLCMVLPLIPAADAASVRWKKTDIQLSSVLGGSKVQKDGTNVKDPDQLVRASIVLEGASTVEAGYATMGIAQNRKAMDYRADLQKVQKQMEKRISAQALGGQPLDVVWNMTLVGNIISAWVPYGKLEAIAEVPGVKIVAMEAQYEPCVVQKAEPVQPNAYSSSGMIGTSVLWESGLTGAGSRIAIVDTGTDTDHQSFDNGAYLHALESNASAAGMGYEEYIASLDLLDVNEIADVLTELNVYRLNPWITAEQLYLNDKLAFGYNYVDASLDIVHDYDQQGEHGSHVAGIAAANRFVPMGGSYMDAVNAVATQGVAPDAQVITMKVFGQSSPYDSDYFAAIEDAILLNCDAVNLSMGTPAPGSPYNDVYSDLLEMMTQTDTVVVLSAGNASNWASTTLFGYLYNDDVNFDAVGSPGSLSSSLTVASVDNNGTVGYYFKAADQKVFYTETIGYGNAPMAGLDISASKTGTQYEYVLLDSLGYPEDYQGVDVAGKFVFISRGTLNYAVKANNAAANGAVGVAIYNNQSGTIYMDLTGLNYAIPVVSITQEEMNAIRAASVKEGSYHTGRLTVYGNLGVEIKDSENYTMSEFSSWGVPGDLTLKPEITAPGGNIYSIWGSNYITGGGSDKYEFMSGTSMAAPQVTGMVALLAQYIREERLDEKTGMSARHLAQSLLMSTATPLREEASGGNYYSLLNQGAGLGRVDLAAAAESYIHVSGQDDYKVKAELGDDPQRTGVYTFDFTIHNMSGETQSYALRADLFRQDVFEYQAGSGIWLLDTWTTDLAANVSFTGDHIVASSGVKYDLNGDGKTNAEDADFLLEYVVGNKTELKTNGDFNGDGVINSYDAHLLLASLSGDVVTVSAGGSATVTVTMVLTKEAKAELDAQTPNGTYVEAFVYAESITDAEGNPGTTHSIPVLAFYGDWSEPSMFDRGTHLELAYMTADRYPYLYDIIGTSGNALSIDYGNGDEFYYGGNPILEDAAYLPERNAFSSISGARIVSQYFTLIRNAGAVRLQITNTDTGEVYFQRELGELWPAYFNASWGAWENVIQYATLNWSGTDAYGKPLPEGTEVAISLTAVPHYYRQEDGSYSFEGLGSGCTMTTTVTIDNTAPEASNIDLSIPDANKLVVKAKDNEYVSAVMLLNATGTEVILAQSPNQDQRNAEVAVELDLTGVYGNKFLVAVCDYALNMEVYEVELNLGEPPREYFTAIDLENKRYVSIAENGAVSELCGTGLTQQVRAAEYVGGYVFLITEDSRLYVADDKDFANIRYIRQLDPTGELKITGFNDMAYNYADGKLYASFYSNLNSQATPYLCTIDMTDGSIGQRYEVPFDANTLAIDGEGTFYSAGYGTKILYAYTLEDVKNGTGATEVGTMGYYSTTMLSSMAWDHNEDKLYWAFPNTLLRINYKTAEPTLLGYHNADVLVGLYIRPENNEDSFVTVDRVDRVELNCTKTRVVRGYNLALEATVWPWNASDRSVTWTSSDASVATVDKNGKVTALAEGTCTITAVSDLDMTKTQSCEITVFALDKKLNALIWDENGAIFMGEFEVGNLSDITKLHEMDLGNDLASATVNDDGTIYAASLNMSSFSSSLYTLDAKTFQPSLIGSSISAYMDIAPAPGQPGESLMAVCGGTVLNVDATTGEYYNNYSIFGNYLVGLAYVGTTHYTDWGFDAWIDWYFLVDQAGVVYLMGFLEQDGVYYYIEHDTLAPDGVYANLGFKMDTPYFGCAYFDGEMLYFSAFKESQNNVTLLALDVVGGSKAVYNLGCFDNGIWPVSGIMEFGKIGGNVNIITGANVADTLSMPAPVEPQNELMGICDQPEEKLTGVIAPLSDSSTVEDLVYVDVMLPTDSTNADMTITFDTRKLELVAVAESLDVFAWKVDDGKIDLSMAAGSMIPAGQTVARLIFRIIAEGKTEIRVRTELLGETFCDAEEIFTVGKEHTHRYENVVTAPTCTEQGYTTYRCDCGDSYIGDYVDALGHAYADGICTRCGAEDPDFVLEEIASGWCGYTQWTLTADGTLTIYGNGTIKNYGYNGNLPWLAYADQIKHVVIEEGITGIGTGAFMGLTKLESVTLPETGLTRIGEAAFYGCAALKEIYIPDGVYTIWAYTFKGCTSLESVRLPKTLIKIDQGAFENCTALPYVFIPTNVKIIGSWSFKGCTALKEADMQWADATEIREGAFKNCSSLTKILLPANIQVLGDSCFYGIGATSFVVPETVTRIEGWCFARAYSLKSITFLGDAPAIGEGAFNKIAVTVLYPSGNTTWNESVMQDYGGKVTWKAD